MQVRGKKHQHYQGTADLGSGWIGLFDVLFMNRVVRTVCLSNSRHRNGRRLKCCLLQVTIIIFLSVVGALLFYMLFLLLVDPLIRKPDPLAQTLHNEEDPEVTALYIYWFQASFKILEFTQCVHLYLLILRKCTHQWAAPHQEETRSWSGWRAHSSAGRSRSRSNARLSSTAIKCLVKLKRWPVV